MSQAKPIIVPGSRVVMHYRLTLEDGMVVDSTWEDDEPIDFTLGDGTLIAGLEEALHGLAVGDNQTIHLTPDQAFGHKDTANIHTLPRDDFPAEMVPEPGQVIGFALPNGDELPGMVLEVSEATVLVDFNHPLSGHAIGFEVAILEVTSPEAANDNG